MTTHLQYGIDLGTTNSCVARATGLDLRVYQNNDQMNVTPSVVRVLKTGRVITGKRAYNAIADDAANIAREFKRWMGQKAGKDFPSTGRSMSAEELSAEIIKSLRDDVARAEGESPTASVVTVPAAFGALQCEATARACNLGGLVQAPLLQEPLAAAIAYGIAPGARDQRWLVFDFGGGTLDVAVVSTKDGRLSVLEHRGNNLLGGKDIDRAIVEHVLLPAVKASFRLPDPAEDPARFARLMQHLLVSAEEAKIDLSSTESVVVSLIDLGLDADGRAIELELSVSRSELERTMEPILDRAIRLAEEALTGARTASDDLDRVLLVGGPTQSPHVRDTIASRLKARVDLSVDPMTAVARGAALYAATIEREYHPPLSATRVTAEATRQRIVLAYDAVSATLSPIIAGRLDGGAGRVSELRLETDGGFWTSGWLSLLDGTFETQPMLQEGKASRIFIYGRDATGTLVDVEPDELSIRHGLVVASPPLPHTLSVEVMRANGKMELDPIFKRGTSLPAERSVRYRADRSAKPGLAETSLAIKLWEGEAFSNPSDNDWVGHVTIEATEISRTIPEGSEIEITIRIDASRIITIEAFVPILNQHFADRLFVPKEQEKDYDEIASTMPSEIEDYRARLTNIRSAMDGKKSVAFRPNSKT
jgi:molecular chaperone DnaK